MTAPSPLRVDVAILGGGIAGLWLLARLEQAGYSALLLESHALGGGQTLASQGIIHGGLKYALDLKLGGASDALADMPARWRACLGGSGEIDLRAAAVATERHLFWARRTLASRVTGFFGSRMLRGRVDALAPAAWPAVLQDRDHVGAVYALDETVLDVPALLQALAGPRLGRIRKIAGEIAVTSHVSGVTLDVSDDAGAVHRIEAAALVSTAGTGNEALLAHLDKPASLAQRRPLQMLMIANAPGPLWAHCFDVSDKPRITVTSHRRADGELVWYVGGLLAEEGARQAPDDLIAAGRREFAMLLPGLDFSRSRFASLHVDRAEGATADGRKPDGPVLHRDGRIWLAWPTKLALAPRLADMLLQELPPPAVAFDASAIAGWAPPAFAAPPWEAAQWK